MKLLCVGILSCLCLTAGENKTKPGELVIDPPTLINLGFEWVIDGDDNRNAAVEVSYRKKGETQWKQALPLLRLQGERIFQTEGVFDVAGVFAGMFVLAAFVIVIDAIVTVTENRLLVWRPATVDSRP